MPKLVFTKGPHAGQEVQLPETGSLTIGRRPECDLHIQDDMMSGKHARLEQVNDGWKIEDLDSSNGTFVNGEAVHTTLLHDNDVIVLGGDTEFTLHTNGADSAGRTPAPGLSGVESSEPRVSAPPRPPVAVPQASQQDLELVKRMRGLTDSIKKEVGKVIVGQLEMVDQILMSMIAGGHALLIGMPGMAKTLTVSTIAKVLDLDFKRIQFTPDLMPTDITGTEILETNRDTNEKEFRFIKGPLFCNLLLADEINRTPPKTQAALLEAMQEKCITTGNVTYTLDPPFFVLATQNPLEQEGTYPLPEAQQDRFMFNIWVDYPSAEEEEIIIGSTTVGKKIEPQKVLSKEQVLQLQDVVKKIPVSEHVIKYTIRLVRATRPADPEAPEIAREFVSTGAGPRAGQFLVLAAKARAVLEGRIHVSCNDIRAAAIPVLRHRVYTNFAADSEGLTAMDIVKKLVDTVAEPGEEAYSEEKKGKDKKIGKK